MYIRVQGVQPPSFFLMSLTHCSHTATHLINCDGWVDCSGLLLVSSHLLFIHTHFSPSFFPMVSVQVTLHESR